jgi:hypothetical protein
MLVFLALWAIGTTAIAVFLYRSRPPLTGRQYADRLEMRRRADLERALGRR